MSKSSSKSNYITGVFTVIVMLSVFGMVMYLQGFKSEVEGERYSVRFADSGGISANAAVLVAGQKVGKVERVETMAVGGTGNRNIEVLVKFIIDEKFASKIHIPLDTVATVAQQGLFGSPSLSLKLGNSSDVLKPGATLPIIGKPPTEIGQILDAANKTVTRLNEGFEGIIEVLENKDTKDNLEASLKSLSSALKTLDKGLADMKPAFKGAGDAVESTRALAEEIRALIADNRESMDRIVSNLESTTSKFDKMMGEDENGIPHLVAGLNAIANNLDDLVANLNDVVLDNKLSINISMENIRETTDSLRVFAKRIENDPSLLVWGDDQSQQPGLDQPRPTPNVDELEIRNSGRRPRKSAD
ncbi:MAG: MlaD family protein [Planctomycetota bacterium]